MPNFKSIYSSLDGIDEELIVNKVDENETENDEEMGDRSSFHPPTRMNRDDVMNAASYEVRFRNFRTVMYAVGDGEAEVPYRCSKYSNNQQKQYRHSQHFERYIQTTV